MELIFIGENQSHTNALKSALSDLGLPIQIFKDLQTFEDDTEKDTPSLFLCVVTSENIENAAQLAEKRSCFAFVQKNDVPSGLDDFIGVFEMPSRLGIVVDVVSSYLHQREQKNKLQPIQLQDFILDPRSNIFENKAKKLQIKLTEKEQDILLYLHAQKGSPVSRQNLLDHVWGYVDGVETHTLETHIYRLRQKIEEDPSVPKLLVTNERGYCLNL